MVRYTSGVPSPTPSKGLLLLPGLAFVGLVIFIGQVLVPRAIREDQMPMEAAKLPPARPLMPETEGAKADEPRKLDPQQGKR